ncbi:MAG: leucine-rich repeat domain-containing protein [Bacteroidales bacterium]|nr:leucine-rich repeat domain-containing protein [Bacteroidales bacterium]
MNLQIKDGVVVGFSGEVPEELVIEGVREVAEGVFKGCRHLRSLKVIGGVIGKSAFKGCHKLKKVELVRVIGVKEEAFCDCGKLKELILGEIKWLGERAFQGCSSLRQVKVPYSLKSIPGTTFLKGCILHR